MFLAAILGVTLLLSVAADHYPGNVAFTAGFRKDYIAEGNMTVVYPEVITNHGSGYTSEIGEFKAPKSGIYVFQIHALSVKSKEFWIELYKNDEYQVSAFGRQKDEFANGGNAIVLKLVKGDRVYVKAHRTSYLYGRNNEVYATFTGVLIGLTC